MWEKSERQRGKYNYSFIIPGKSKLAFQCSREITIRKRSFSLPPPTPTAPRKGRILQFDRADHCPTLNHLIIISIEKIIRLMTRD